MSAAYPPPVAGPPPPPPAAPPAPGPAHPADVAVTVVLIVLFALAGLVSFTLGIFLTTAAAGCSDNACADRIAVGVALVELAPLVAWLPTTIWAVVRLARGKVAFWVPLLSVPVYLGLALAGLSMLGT